MGNCIHGDSTATNFTPNSQSHYSLTPNSQINRLGFTNRAWEIIVAAVDVAVENKQVVECKHLMKALLQQEYGLTTRIFAKAGLDIQSLLNFTLHFKSPPPKGKTEITQPKFCKHLSSVLNNARKHKEKMGDAFVSVEHLVLALYSDKSFGHQLFNKFQLTKKDLTVAVQAVRRNHKVTSQYPELKFEADKYATDLILLSAKTHFVSGRNDEIEQCIQILLRLNKNIPLITGERGVGKTTIVKGLAQRIAQGDVPEGLRNRKLISLDMGLLIVDAKSRGDFEETFMAVLKEVTASNGQIILFIHHIHIVVAGATGSTVNACTLFKSMLDRGELRCIGTTTSMDYEKYIENDPTLEQRFQQVSCGRRYVHDTNCVVCGPRDKYRLYRGVKTSDRRALFYPNKAIDLVDEAVENSFKISNSKKKFHEEVTDAAHVAEIIRNSSGMSLPNLQIERDELSIPEQIFHQSVIGQDTAVKFVADVVQRVRNGLFDSNRPIAKFMFAGPTGVGKSELVKALASYLYGTKDALIHVHMSEYIEGNSITRLIGPPPGTIGYEYGGQLTNAVGRRPCSVVFFDQIEHAHPDVLKIVLRLLTDGRLTDSHGRTISFTSCIIIMTSQIGSDYILETPYSKEKDIKDEVYELAKQTFGLEFMDQIDEHIVFHPLDLKQICNIAEIRIKELHGRLEKAKNIDLHYTREALELIGTLSFKPGEGALAIRRVMRHHVEIEIMKQIRKGNVKVGDSVIVDIDESSSSPKGTRLCINKAYQF